MNIDYRIGKKGDCPRIAALINIASGGVIEYLFYGLVPAQSPVEIIAYNLESDDEPYSYNNVIVAEENGQVVGMALSFPSEYHHITEEMAQFFPSDRLSRLRPFYTANVEQSLFLDALCVDEAYQKKGVGSHLIQRTKQKAHESGYQVLSLIVFNDNTKAQRVYQKNGFEVVEEISLDAHELIPHEGGCLLMKCDVSSQ